MTQATQTGASAGAEQVARGYFEAVAARDADAMASFWADDGVEDIVPLGIFRGPEEVRVLFGELFAAFPDFDFVVTRVTADGGHVVVEWRATGTFSGDSRFQGIAPNGRRISLRGADCLDVEDGRIVRNTAFYDGMGFARDLGLMPPLDSAAERTMKKAFNAVTALRARVGR